jgi:acetate kinase
MTAARDMVMLRGMDAPVLVVNTGSSSVKLRVLDTGDEVLAARDDGAPTDADLAASIEAFLAEAPEFQAAGHRIVHGGSAFRESAAAGEETVDRLEAIVDLAPLHNNRALAALEAARRLRPDIQHVLCFDTAFHATLPEAAARYAVPERWHTEWGIRRYGFHGLSHSYAAQRAADLLGRADGLRVVSCHLGAGASLAAVRDGRSVDTTMGFTPNDGLMMATRSGSFDPGALLWLQEHVGLSRDDAEQALEHESGLLGLSGLSADMRELLDAAARGHEAAALAVEVYLHRLRAGIAAMAAAMDGVDALVFTGGVGENSHEIRRRACDGLGFLGVALDEGADSEAGEEDAVIGGDDAVAVLLVHAREDIAIVREVRRVLSRR